MHMLVHEAAHSHDLLHEVLFMNWVYAYVNEFDVCTCGRRTMQTRQVVSTDQTSRLPMRMHSVSGLARELPMKLEEG